MFGRIANRQPRLTAQLLALALSSALAIAPAVAHANIAGDLPPVADPVPQVDERGQATQDAVADAEIDVNGGTWFVLGCVLNVYGVLAAWFTDPEPPYARLVGKQERYVQTYIPVYRSEASSLRQRYALYGCLASVGASLVFVTMMTSLSSNQTTTRTGSNE